MVYNFFSWEVCLPTWKFYDKIYRYNNVRTTLGIFISVINSAPDNSTSKSSTYVVYHNKTHHIHSNTLALKPPHETQCSCLPVAIVVLTWQKEI